MWKNGLQMFVWRLTVFTLICVRSVSATYRAAFLFIFHSWKTHFLSSKKELSPGQSPSTATPWKPQTLRLTYHNITNHAKLYPGLQPNAHWADSMQCRTTICVQWHPHIHTQTATYTNKCVCVSMSLSLNEEARISWGVVLFIAHATKSMEVTMVTTAAEGLKDKHWGDNHLSAHWAAQISQGAVMVWWSAEVRVFHML